MKKELPTDDRLIDLLAMRAAEGLPAEAERELGDWADCDLLEEAASVLAVGMAFEGGLDAMPDSLHDSMVSIIRREWAGEFAIAEAAPGRVEPKPAESGVVGQAVGLGEDANDQTGSYRADSYRGRNGGLSALAIGGWLAAAACLALFVIVQSPARTPTIGERLALMESKPGIVRTAWLGLDDADLSETPHAYDQTLSGEVVWDPETNEGYMVFEGLGENDPSLYQYQLWIFDADRPTGQLPQYGEGILSQLPVDGGVFDATGGRVIVPIDAKLPVGQAAVFAITVEPPGGVVVSDRDIVTLALVN
jgi:hypothetical protein